MVDQTQSCPSAISPLGLFPGIICHIERTKGGGGDLILKGESQTPLETMVKKENIDLKWVKHSTNNDWFKLLQNLNKSRFNTANC